MNNKKIPAIVILLLVVTVGVTLADLFLFRDTTEIIKDDGADYVQQAVLERSEKYKGKTDDSKGIFTMDNISGEMAELEIRAYGLALKEGFGSDALEAEEKALEEMGGFLYVCLGNISESSLVSVKEACSYFFTEYPEMKGYVTNMQVCTDASAANNVMAVYDESVFLMPETDLYPIVCKNQVLLAESYFCNDKKITNLVRKNVGLGFWAKGSSLTSAMVHELGHAYVGRLKMLYYGLSDNVFVSEADSEKYMMEFSEDVEKKQTFARKICLDAYEAYVKDSGKNLEYEEFVGMISGYAAARHEDGIYMYEETIAETFADKYINGKDMCDASKYIFDAMKKISQDGEK